MSLIPQAIKIIYEDADQRLIDKISRLIETNEAEWREDPVVPGVVGCVISGTNTAVCVVYVNDRDFEVNEEYV